MRSGVLCQHVHPAIDRLVHFCAQLLYDVSHSLSQLLLEYCEVCSGDHVCLLFLLELPLVAATAVMLCLASELPERSRSWRRSPMLRYHVKQKSVLWHA